MNPRAIFEGSNGEATKRLYEKLETHGAVGRIILNLFRACKCSSRAKVYSRRHKGDAYSRKEWSMQNLCRELQTSATELGMEWGWKVDPAQEYHCWVLYCDTPYGQVSFHAAERMCPKDYPGDWDGLYATPTRIIAWATDLLDGKLNDSTNEGLAVLRTAFKTPNQQTKTEEYQTMMKLNNSPEGEADDDKGKEEGDKDTGKGHGGEEGAGSTK